MGKLLIKDPENKCSSAQKKAVIFTTLMFLGLMYNLSLYSDSDDSNLDNNSIKRKTRLTLPWQEKYKNMPPEDLNEILRLIHNTPYLWGYRGRRKYSYERNETVASRMDAQRTWVKELSATNFIKSTKRKKTLLFVESKGGDEYYFTDNKIVCPYALEFQDKCEIVLDSTGWIELLQNPKSEQFYRDLKVDAVVGKRNGYWGYDSDHKEPQVPNEVKQMYYVHESPCHSGSARVGETDAWLISYWRGADIPIPCREVVKIVRKTNATNSVNLVKNNRKPVVALISNCVYIQNNRLAYIEELKKHIDVDFYGNCGDNQCPEEGDCLEFLGSKFKFFLAFENCNCEDYITEKLFLNALGHGMIPVVMGGRLGNYLTAYPPNSFIYVDNFTSPKKLAEYLGRLDKNKDLYEQYHAWRYDKHFEWTITPNGLEDVFCRLCGLLYYYDFQQPDEYSSRSVRWKNLDKCLLQGQWNWGK